MNSEESLALVVNSTALKRDVRTSRNRGVFDKEDVPGVKDLLELTFGLLSIRDIWTLTGRVSRLSIVAILGTLLIRVQAYFRLVLRMLLVTCGLRPNEKPQTVTRSSREFHTWALW